MPEGLNSSNIPVYSGKVLISGDNGEELGVPYFGKQCQVPSTGVKCTNTRIGVGADLQSEIKHVFDYGKQYPFVYSGLNNAQVNVKSKYVYPHMMTAHAY